jgi:hypothetical protein
MGSQFQVGSRKQYMRKLLQIIPIFLMIVGSVLLFERPALAYADPGTGLLAVQAVGSAVVAVGWYLRRKIYSFFHRAGAAEHGSVAYRASEDEQS